MRIVFDIETNPAPNVTKIWCIAAIDIDTNKIYKFGPSQIMGGLSLLQQATILYAHNGISFDAKVIRDLYNIDLYNKLVDTYICSQLLFPLKEAHGLGAWGKELGFLKWDYKDFDTYSEEMLQYCEQDVLVTHKLLQHLWTKTYPGFKDVLKFEQEFARVYEENCTKVWVDVKWGQKWARRLQYLLNKINKKIEGRMPLRQANITTKTKDTIYTKDGSYLDRIKKWAFANDIVLTDIKGPFTPLVYANPASSRQMVPFLLQEGWKPDTFTDGGQPSLSKSKFIGVEPKLRKLLKHRGLVSHRLNLILGILEKCQPTIDGSVGYINPYAATCGAVTGRMKHRVLVNFPRPSTPLGALCRGLIIPEPGKVLVGCDASQLEARIEGHATYPFDGGKYAKWLLEVTDLHTFNAESWGISRNDAKSVVYCLSYQGKAPKVAEILKCDLKKAEYIYEKFWADRPAARQLILSLEDEMISSGATRNKNGRLQITEYENYILGIDGRRLFVTRENQIKNYYIQSTGNLAMKIGMIKLHNKLRKLNLDAKIIVFMHDEYQIECLEKDVDLVRKLCQDSIKEAGEDLSLNMPLESETSVGKSWRETH